MTTEPDQTRSSALAGLGLAPRLFMAMALVVLSGAGTLLLVALVVAPAVFYSHLHRAGVPAVSPAVQTHVDEAFAQALLVSLGIGVLVAGATATLVTWLVSRRLAAPVSDLAQATSRLAGGHYDTTVPDPGLGPEFSALTAAVNQLAVRLGSSEEVRRRLLADLTHELRTPLASLEATVEAMIDGILPVDEITLTTLTEQASRLHRLVADLESVSRAEERQLSLTPRRVLLADIAHRAAAVLGPRFETKGVELTVSPSTSRPLVVVDEDRLLEAVMNLLENALQHTPSGGTVTVSVDTARGATPLKNSALLTVADTGSGFDPAEGASLFERFYRADTARRTNDSAARTQGSGIGLTITRAIVEAHSGTITADSGGPGTGARFTISLPSSGAATEG